jgi:hypothetical protein
LFSFESNPTKSSAPVKHEAAEIRPLAKDAIFKKAASRSNQLRRGRRFVTNVPGDAGVVQW